MSFKKLTRILFLAAALAPFGLFAAPLHIVLVGDSTVTEKAGWGAGFKQCLAPDVELSNTARGGRSSMSFIKEGSWEKALALKGDYYFIQFGHNDEPGKEGRSTTIDEFRSYMTKYVDDVFAIDAKPVLVTPLVRRQFKDKNNPNRIVSSLEAQAAVVREIAREKNIPLIELHDRSKAVCEKLGPRGCEEFSPVKDNGNFDGTHLNEKGHVLFGRLVADEVRKTVPELAPLIDIDATPAAKTAAR